MATAIAGATMQDILTNFAKSTTVHGVPRVILSRSYVVRTLWAVICLAAGTLFCAQMYEVLVRYFSYPTDVTVKVVQMPIPFPAVSFCNMRNLDFTVLNTINRMFLASSDPVSHINQSRNMFINEYMQYVAKFTPIYFIHGYKTHDTSDSNYFDEIFSFSSLSSNIPEEIIANASLQLDEFIIRCRFRGHSCNTSEVFTTFFDQQYFHCFTFNSPDAFSHDIGTSEILLSDGIEYGLSVTVLTGSTMLDRNNDFRLIPCLQETRSSLTFGDGVRVVIHSPKTKPFPLDDGYDVPPGYSASFGIAPRRNKRMALPYGNCTSIEAQHYPLKQLKRNKSENESAHEPYHVTACQKQCIQKYVIEGCGCYDKSMPMPISRNGDSLGNGIKGEEVKKIRPCREMHNISASCMLNASEVCLGAFFDITKRIECMRETRINAKHNGTLMSQCSCYQACDEITYSVSYSTSKYLGLSFGSDYSMLDLLYKSGLSKRLKKNAQSRGLNLTWWVEDEENFIKNKTGIEKAIQDFSRINVYIADINIIEIEESPSYTRDQLISDIGGQLGIWIGVSVISISEVIEVILTLIGHLFSDSQKNGGKDDGKKSRKSKRRLQKRSTSKDVEEVVDNPSIDEHGEKSIEEISSNKITSM